MESVFIHLRTIRIRYRRKRGGCIEIKVATDKFTRALLGADALMAPVFPEGDDTYAANSRFRLHIGKVLKRLGGLDLDGGNFYENGGKFGWEVTLEVLPRRKKHQTIGG